MQHIFNVGDAAIFVVNGDEIPVTIESVEYLGGGTRHDVKLGAAIQGCEAGEIVTNCFSYVTDRLTRTYGDTRSIYPVPASPTLAELEAESAEIAELSAMRDAELQAERGASSDISARVIGLDPAAAERELETTKRPRTVNQIKSVASMLQDRLARAVERGGASSLYRIDVEAGTRFQIAFVRLADDVTIASSTAGHDVAAAELYRLGADVFHAGIAAEIESIVAESRQRTAAAAGARA